MKSHQKIAFVLMLSSLTLSSVVPMFAQRKSFSMPTYTPPPSRPAPTQSSTYSRPAETQSQPSYNRPAQTQSQSYSAPAQRQTNTAPAQRPAPSAATSRPSTSNQTIHPGTVTNPSAPSPKEDRVQQQRRAKVQAQQQKESAKQAQNAQKDQARQQKEAAKQQQKQQKEAARQQKEKMKQEQKAQKEQARHQKTNGNRGTSQTASSPSSSPAAKPDAPPARTSQAHNSSASAYHVPEGSSMGKTATGSTTLDREGSRSVVQQVNSARSHMSGVNRKPLPAGDVTVHANGRLTLNAAGGQHYGVRPDGSISSYRDNTKTVNFDRKGRVSSLHTANLDIRRGAHGQRTVISRRADNSRVVSTGRHSGYIERNVVVGNQTYIQRTNVINGRTATNHYVGFTYGGVAMARFVTPVFYAPAFYGWAFYPWPAPISFTFGWMGAPWYVGPNPFFVAYPMYPSAAFWLTDYMLGETLAAGYRMHEDAMLASGDDDDLMADASSDPDDDQLDTASAPATTPISSELKAQIVEEVKEELSYDNAASRVQSQETKYDEITAVVGRPHHVFVVSSDLDVTTTDEQACSLQPGDMLRLEAAPADGSLLAELSVASSKQMDCPAGVTVTVALSDLQEMHNNFRAQVEAGLGALQAGQGQDGIPAAPAAALAAPPRPTLVGVETVSAAQVTATLESERKQADQAVADATAAAF
jgi:hypothetical protein